MQYYVMISSMKQMFVGDNRDHYISVNKVNIISTVRKT